MNTQKLKEYFDELVESSYGKGVVFKLYKNYEEVFSYKGGFRDAKHEIPADYTDAFYIYSLTKPITCAAAMQLVEKGLLDLYAPVSNYLPYFKDVKVANGDKTVPLERDILVWNLFNMSAGLNYERGKERYNAAVEANKGTSEVFEATVLDVPLSFQPGEHWQYACRSHEALACIIEKLSGKTFYEYLNENIFAPLEMKHLKFKLDNYLSEHLADLFTEGDDNGFALVPRVDFRGPTPLYESGGYGLISDIIDYSKFANAMANLGMGENGNRILKEETINLMRKDFLTDKNREDFWRTPYGYGYGLGVRTLISKEPNPDIPLGEFGWDGAAGGYTLFDPENKIAAVFLTHTLSGNKKLDQFKIRDLIYSK